MGCPLVAQAAKLTHKGAIIHIPNSLIDEPSFFHCVDGGLCASRFGLGGGDLGANMMAGCIGEDGAGYAGDSEPRPERHETKECDHVRQPHRFASQ